MSSTCGKYNFSKLTEYGIGLVAMEIASNYSAAEIVSHIILCTIALDAKEAGDDADIGKLMEIASSSISVSKCRFPDWYSRFLLRILVALVYS